MKANPVFKCPKCGFAPLDFVMLYDDLLVSARVDSFKYTCPECKLSFEVKA